QAVGTLLVLGLLIGPAATAALITRTVPRMMIASLVIGVVSVTVGLILSYHLGTAAGASMALIAILGFFMGLTIRAITAAISRRPRSAIPSEKAASCLSLKTTILCCTVAPTAPFRHQVSPFQKEKSLRLLTPTDPAKLHCCKR